MLDRVTPVILTYNEEANLDRTLTSLRWARRVVIVDSGSSDATGNIATAFPNVAFYVRPFDSYANQWEFGVHGTTIQTEYVLGLDADLATPDAFVAELEDRFLPGGYAGGTIPFEYWVLETRLFGSLLSPQLRLFRRNAVQIAQRGHAHKFVVEGPVYQFSSRIRHDDRKSIERWVSSQVANSLLEANRLEGISQLSIRDWIRTTGIMPLIAGFVGYMRAGGPICGRAALKYAYERMAYECLLAMRLQERQSKKSVRAKRHQV